MDTTTFDETTISETTNAMETTARPVTPELQYSTFSRPGEQTLSPLSPVTPATPATPATPEAPVLLLDPSANLSPAPITEPANLTPATITEPANLTSATITEPLPSSPPMTPPRSPSATVTEPPAVIRHRFVRTFRAERAGSDTEEEEGLPVPTSPLVRQMGRCCLSDDDETERVGVPDSEAEGGEETDADSEAEEGEETDQEEAEDDNGVMVPAPNGMVIQVPVWLFVTTLVAMVTYLFFVVYLLAWSCPAVKLRS